MVLSINSIGFIVGVFLIALLCWYLRSRIESDPEPFFLGLTFFAFAGQFIRTAEYSHLIVKGRGVHGYGTILILLFLGLAAVIGQAFVMKTHMQITKDHYSDLLKRHHLRPKEDHQIERWTTVLLRITGVDFFPGGYGWIKDFFPANVEPREQSRRLAVAILPPKEFRINVEGKTNSLHEDVAKKSVSELNVPQSTRASSEADGITDRVLIVPASRQRRIYWWSYVLLCVTAWGLFIYVMMILQEPS